MGRMLFKGTGAGCEGISASVMGAEVLLVAGVEELQGCVRRVSRRTVRAVHGGGNTRESLLVSCIERKARCEAAVNFMRMMNGAMAGLDESEKELIFNFHIDHLGIGWVCRNYHLGKSRAYEICDRALAHLDSLLF